MAAVESSDDAVVACTLSAADMGPRLTRIRELTRAHLRTHELNGSTLRLVYGSDAKAELADIVDLERQCCGFLTFHLTENRDSVELLIVGPPQESNDAQWLFSQFLPESPAGLCGCGRG